MFSQLFSRLSNDIAIDLGTANSLVYVKGQGIVIVEPSVVALNKKTDQILAIGKEAKEMVGRTPAHIVAVRPLVSGVVSNFEVTEEMLRYFIEKAQKRKFIFGPRPRVIIGIPCGVTEVEKKAVHDAAKNAGAREVFLIEQPMAAAIGARLPVQEAGGNFIVDIGGGTTEVAVLSLGGIVTAKSLRIAGDKLNEDIIRFAQEEYNLLIGPRTAETLKIEIGSVFTEKAARSNAKQELKNNKNKIRAGLSSAESNRAPKTSKQEKSKDETRPAKTSRQEKKERTEMTMRGRNLLTGLPEEVFVSSDDIRKALEKSVRQIVQEIKATVEETPPELLADIMHRGIYLAGGGALLRGLDVLIAKETKIPTHVVEDPLTAVVRGAGQVLEKIDQLHDVLVEPQRDEPPK